MKNLIILIAALGLLSFTGCGNLSPRNDLENKINGNKNEIDNLQNSINMEIGKLRNQTEVNARDLRNLQQGFINYNRENSGIQILQGEGPLILVFAIAVVFMILWFQTRNQAKKAEKAADILAETIVMEDDIEIENAVFNAAIHCGVEKEMLKAFTKYQKYHGIIR